MEEAIVGASTHNNKDDQSPPQFRRKEETVAAEVRFIQFVFRDICGCSETWQHQSRTSLHLSV
jgi:hypothetical protein